jgi:hypothetical protein
MRGALPPDKVGSGVVSLFEDILFEFDKFLDAGDGTWWAAYLE